jgi:hypothetical protein
MCSHDISDNLADRIAIVIHVGGLNVKNNFISYVDCINTTLDRYYPKISEVLK